MLDEGIGYSVSGAPSNCSSVLLLELLLSCIELEVLMMESHMDMFLTALHFAVFILMFVLTTLFFRFHFFSALVCSDFCYLSLYVYPHFLHSVPYLLLRTHHNNLSSFPSPLSPALLLSINVLFVVPLLFTLLQRFSSHFGVVVYHGGHEDIYRMRLY